MNTIDFRQYKDAQDMMKKTGLSAEECLRLVDQELEKLRGNT